MEELEERTVPGFLAPVSYSVNSNLRADVATGDFNGDGIPDLVSANGADSAYNNGHGTLSLLLGRGDGALQSSQTVSLDDGWTADSVAVADFNDDGTLDLVAGSQKHFWTTFPPQPPDYGYVDIAPTVLLGNGDGTFQPGQQFHADFATQYFAPGFATSTVDHCSVAVGDFDSDGALDLVVTSGQSSHDSFDGDYEIDRVTVLQGHGDGTFSSVSQTAVNAPMLAVGGVNLAAGDVNRDGALDLATSVGDLLLGNGDGTFAVTSATESSADVALADLNGDGRLDLATAGPNVRIHLGAGDGTFQSYASYATAGTALIAVGELDRDGAPDLVAASPVGDNVRVLLGHGDGTFEPLGPFAAGPNPVALALVDLNGDGRPDAATANGSASIVSVLLNNGDWTVPTLPSIQIDDVRKQERHKGTILFVFTVSLSTPFDQPATVHFSTADGAATVADDDYVDQSGTVTFAPGQTTQTITIVTKGDRRSEPDETFFVNLSDASNATIVDGLGIGTILNDDRR